ncbi:ABC transporter permease [Intestinimonas butyriciproducens]|mgnify:CR=1 FL=1|uniref:Transport permease protein n=1 Tax=Intestinimonas butyriciproducens TaxID=1297617 RepID=A0A0S2W556_9FIRM|nr:ABC transporter permease [Intestinimonas butyriciproducens]ALP94478.1 O-antigen export system permease protein RfbD [Intestinimonas butyriciproducens]MBO3280160.1 ABC transporter permease [Intestinimonas butyriciproducens]MDB7860662.1 ABC transporter permease [Intestinimonas butyriciproducens]MDB7862824.1 ABC transporter permease [Intestinimonas butyriciproducens]
MKANAKQTTFDLKRICARCISVYVVLVILLYFLMGYQLHFRDSRGNIELQLAESGTVELVQGAVVEQTFSMKTQRLREVSVQWGTYYRPNSGTATMELYNQNDGTLVLSKTFDVAEITEGGLTTMTAEEPIEGLYDVPLLLRVYADSESGTAASPLMSVSAGVSVNEGSEKGQTPFSLTVNGQPAEGVLCFSATGEDYIWTGLHYWKFAAAMGAVIGLYLLGTYWRWKQGKHSFLANALVAMQKYRFLIKQLVDRDFKAKYKRSILGVLWSFLNPLLNMLVQYVVFSNMFKFDIPNFPVYLLCGNVVFSYFSESCGMALTSIVGNAGLITKVYVPKYIYPLTRIMSSMVNLLISLIPLFVVALLSGLVPTKAYLLLPVPLLCLAMFCLGLGMLLAAAMVFFRDIQFLWGVLTTIWMYLTPIFYPVSTLPEAVQTVVKMNPLYFYVTFVRTCVINGISPEPVMYAQCALMGLGMLLIGAFVFKRSQDKFVLYL